MGNSGLALFVGGIIVTVLLVMGGVFNLRRHDMKAMKSVDAMTATGTRVWSYLTPQQQDELKAIESLLIQEEWIEENVGPEVLGGVSAERVLIEFANRGFIILGQGVFRRHSSPLDFIEPKAQFIEEETVALEADTEPKEDVEEESLEKAIPVVVISEDNCEQCKRILQDFVMEPASEGKKLPEITEN